MSHQDWDLGSQYNQFIARRVREFEVCCEIKPCTTSLTELKAMDLIGIIFTGAKVRLSRGSASGGPGDICLGRPILGICYGCQLMAYALGGGITVAQDDPAWEYGKIMTYFDTSRRVF